MSERNPFLLPEVQVTKRSCPKCGSEDFNGRMSSGAIIWTCSNPECKNQWQGGMSKEPVNPAIRPPETQPITFYKDPREDSGIGEIRHRQSLQQDFRGGAELPSPGEEDV